LNQNKKSDMEITEVNRTGVTRVTGDVRIRYNIQGNQAVAVSGAVYKNEAIAGYCNAEKDGAFGFSLLAGHSLSGDEVKEVFNAAVDDVQALYGDGDA
jgi:hypothetical protein